MSIDLAISPLMQQAHGTGPALVQRQPMQDARGSFTRLFSADELRAAGWTRPIAHINHSCTTRAGTVRGFHFQAAPHEEMKLVTCIRGSILDIAIDVRDGSATRYRHVAAELSAENGRAMLVPEGFAHGFQALTDDVEMIYLHSAPYVADHALGLKPDDPALGIEWPLPITLMSDKDAAWPLLAGTVR